MFKIQSHFQSLHIMKYIKFAIVIVTGIKVRRLVRF